VDERYYNDYMGLTLCPEGELKFMNP